MAHEITIRQDGFAEIAFVDKTPWHGLGQQLTRDASLDEWRKQAGLDWSILRAPVQFTDSTNVMHDYPGQNVLLRSDNGNPLSIVSDRYKEVQPDTVLEFFRDIVQVAGCRLHTAGSLNGGRRIWALAETGKLGEVVKNDAVAGYLLLATSCDKGLATTARFTTVRVVCANTLAIAERGAATLTVPHSKVFDVAAAQRTMGLQVSQFDLFMQHAQTLAKKDITEAKFQSFLKTLLVQTIPMQARNDPQFNFDDLRSYKRIRELFDGTAMGGDLPGVRGTYWGAVNAVTEYVDHHRPARSTDARLNYAWFHGGETLKTTALNLALAA